MIRKATPNDASQIAAVQVATWRNSYAGIVPKAHLESLSIKSRTEMWNRLLGNPGHEIWVYSKGDCVNGFIAGGPCRNDDLPGCKEIYALYVSPGSQRQGLAKSLVETFLSECGASCALWVLEDNQNGIEFYRSIGFGGRRPNSIYRIGWRVTF